MQEVEGRGKELDSEELEAIIMTRRETRLWVFAHTQSGGHRTSKHKAPSI